MLPRIIIVLIVLTLGIPFLILFAAIAVNPSVSFSIFSSIIGGGIIMTFVILAISEIKRLADQPSDLH
jgi:hypothetical protein